MRAASPAASRFSAISRALRQTVEQGGDQFGQHRSLGFQAAVRWIEVECQGEAARCRRRSAGGQDEGEQLQQIERRHDAQAEAAECRGCVDQQRRRQATQAGGGFRGRQQQQLAVGGEDCGAAVAGYDGRRVGQRNARHGFQVVEVTGRSLAAIGSRRHRHGGSGARLAMFRVLMSNAPPVVMASADLRKPGQPHFSSDAVNEDVDSEAQPRPAMTPGLRQPARKGCVE